jgi:predicted nucleic acid-binding protein
MKIANTVYIETSIPSFYYNIRTEPEMVARENWTREWWDTQRSLFNVVSSEAVLRELESGSFPNKEAILMLMSGIALLPVEPAIEEIVGTYIVHKAMPHDPAGDALHLALASYHKCDFLLTWNCKHLANANKFQHIRRVNGILNLFTPALVTPLELLREESQ